MTAKLVDHPSKKDEDDCMAINIQAKFAVDEVNQQYEDSKININEYT